MFFFRDFPRVDRDNLGKYMEKLLGVYVLYTIFAAEMNNLIKR